MLFKIGIHTYHGMVFTISHVLVKQKKMETSKKAISVKDLIILVVSFVLFALVYAETRAMYF